MIQWSNKFSELKRKSNYTVSYCLADQSIFGDQLIFGSRVEMLCFSQMPKSETKMQLLTEVFNGVVAGIVTSMM